MRRRPCHPIRPVGVAGLGALVAGLLVGCTPTISVPVAEHATDPACADVVLALPDSLGADLPKVRTDSQATAAWGKAGAAVTLRCGVTVPGPTTDQCVTVASGSTSADSAADPGVTEVDWVVRQSGDTWMFTTYGRDPAVEVIVPPAVTAGHSTAFVQDLGPAVARIRATRGCTS